MFYDFNQEKEFTVSSIENIDINEVINRFYVHISALESTDKKDINDMEFSYKIIIQKMNTEEIQVFNKNIHPLIMEEINWILKKIH